MICAPLDFMLFEWLSSLADLPALGAGNCGHVVHTKKPAVLRRRVLRKLKLLIRYRTDARLTTTTTTLTTTRRITLSMRLELRFWFMCDEKNDR
jgi:hypothetical protein